MIDIKIVNVNKSYRQAGKTTRVLQDVSLQIEPGEFFFLLGPSGCGKTTLLRIISGLLEPSDGRILFDDKNVTNMPSDKRDCAMVFQNYALWPHMTVGQNVEFGPQMQKIAKPQRQKIAEEKLEVVKMLDFMTRKSNQLSGGQQQRVALARALAANPKVLLLDEPLSNLDARLRAKMRVELRNLVKMTQTTAIYVTHDQNEALSMADRIALLNEGEIIQIGSPEEIYNRPKTRFVADFIGEANFFSGKMKKSNPLTLETPLGSIVTNESIDVEKDEVSCCVRPEKVAIVTNMEQSQQAPNIFDATVGEIAYFGDTIQVELVLGPDALWRAVMFTGNLGQLVKGQQVKVHVNKEDIIILED